MFKELEKILDCKFKDLNLLKKALTHKSSGAEFNNERLEFLGDAVLDLIVGEYLYHKFKQINEGDLSKLRAALVNESSFAKLANHIKLGKFIFLSLAEEQNNGRKKDSILSDAFEAVMGAIYLENGIDKVRSIFIKILEENYQDINLQSLKKDYKTTLQELSQAKFGITPIYKLIKSSGPDHKKVFEMAACIGEKVLAKGVGKSKKDAEQHAASQALKALQ